MTRNVRAARNFVAFMGVFLVGIGTLLVVAEPAKHWHVFLIMLPQAAWCFMTVRQVNRGEGNWQHRVQAGSTKEPDDAVRQAP